MPKTIKINIGNNVQEALKSGIHVELEGKKLQVLCIARSTNGIFYVVDRMPKKYGGSCMLHIGEEDNLTEARVIDSIVLRADGKMVFKYEWNGKEGELRIPGPYVEDQKPINTYDGLTPESLERLL